ncbi:DUF2510 domain-containing protein [Mycolicibacterium sp. CR10]|uniref:DUF2510 domain-containing protein n=1 Tax=Mycolicibacterium sp. CR10 TaxID=2562314 RepID=UPI0010C10E34|nr:DUF2510 domain-containing protein [Mycolicibacterium sp. CR10]
MSQPEGWYPDPAGGPERKYWDGRRWQLDVRDPRAELNRAYAKSWSANGWAGRSAFFGVASILASVFCLGILFGPLAVITGLAARPKSPRGRRLQVTGVITGCIGFFLSLAFGGYLMG